MKTKFLLLASSILMIIILFFPNYNFAQGTWIQKPDFPGLARYSASGFSIGTKVYVGIGFNPGDFSMNDFWEWDQTTNLWTRKADFPGKIEGSAVSFSIGTKGYIGTGDDFNTNNYTSEFWEYDPATDSWNQKSSFPGVPRGMASGFSIGNKGYIGTGFFWDPGLPDLIYYNDFWEYDQETDTWTKKADFGGKARQGAVGFSIGNKGYIGMGWNGGFDNSSSFLKDFWEYDQEMDSWTRKADFGGIARQGAVGFSLEKSGYIGIGWNNSNLTDFWEWNQLTDTWTQKASFGGIGRPWGVGLSMGNKGYVVTGFEDYTNVFHQDFWEFNTPSLLTAIQELAETEVHFYPNPTNGKFSIRNTEPQLKDFNLEIYDILGKKIYSNSSFMLQTSNEIDLSDSPRGIYFVKINEGKKFYNGKITVQ